MPYHTTLSIASPYQAKEAKVLDLPEDWYEPTERLGKVWRGSRIFRGGPLDPSEVPHKFKTKTRADRLPDMFGMAVGYMVSDILRDKIEELEPGVHRFFDAEITCKGGEVSAKRYRMLQICNVVDAIDEDKSLLATLGRTEMLSPGVGKGLEAKMVLRKEVIEGMCLWLDKRFAPFFMSDELFEFIRKNKLTRLDSWEVFAE